MMCCNSTYRCRLIHVSIPLYYNVTIMNVQQSAAGGVVLTSGHWVAVLRHGDASAEM